MTNNQILKVDAIPQSVEVEFLKAAYQKSAFWGDMFTVCHALGLRNSEARELRAEHVNVTNKQLTITDNKQFRAYVTKTAKKTVADDWITKGQMFLYDAAMSKGDTIRAMIVEMAETNGQLKKVAEKLGLLDTFCEMQERHFLDNIDAARAKAAKSGGPKPRIIDLSPYKAVLKILKNRVEKYGDFCGFLFPVKELGANRANAFEPVSRQTVYNVVRSIRESIETASSAIKSALQGIRTGLHSFRKSAVQRVERASGLIAASIWVGHGATKSGKTKGNLAVTQDYLDTSSRSLSDANSKAAQAIEDTFKNLSIAA